MFVVVHISYIKT